MTECIIFLDESGDLGWKFHQPYRAGGSSRYLTVSSIILPLHKTYLLSRVIRSLYIKHDWQPKKEKKWARMKPHEKLYFTDSFVQLALEHNDIKFFSVIVYKPNVQAYIRQDPDKLYNYVIGLMLMKEIKDLKKVIFTPDPRSIKMGCSNSLYDYLVTKLWFELNAKTELINRPRDSASNKGIQFADMFCGLVHEYFEDKDSELIKLIPKHRVSIRTLFFENNESNLGREYSFDDKVEMIH